MDNLEKNKYWVWFSLIKNLGSKRKLELLKKYKDPKNIYNEKKEELLKINGIGEKIAEEIINKQIKLEVEKHIRFMKDKNINILNINDEKYPKKLKEIYDPPISIYYKGNIEAINNKSVSIVGCREATEYGKKAAKYFAYNLAKQNINIISGLAKGIDCYSHMGAICAKGKTIAVVGTGLETTYPKENKEIENQIIQTGGAIISEYPLGTKPEKMNFPARNRIVSGLSEGIIVVEAKEKSGTLITVDFALEQGREVFVVPGNINSINSVGTNELIKQGAKVATSYIDIITHIL